MTQLVSYIRDFLHDEDATRWSDTRLLYLMNEAQQDLARASGLIADIYSFPLVGALEVYDLPKDLVTLTRVELNGCKLPISSHADLDRDRCVTCWHDKHGKPVVALKDLLARDKIKFYPIPDNKAFELGYAANSFGLISSITSASSYTKDTLGTAGIVGIMDKNYGRGDTVVTGTGGLSGVLGKHTYVVTIHYDRLPYKLTSLSDELEIDQVNHTAIKYYVCGQLLRQDKDTESRSLGKEELALYALEVQKLKKESSLDFTSGDRYEMPYRRAI